MKSRAITLIVLGLALGLSACGRKGPLDTPYQAGIDARRQAEQENRPLPPEPKKPAADRRFFLDGLI